MARKKKQIKLVRFKSTPFRLKKKRSKFQLDQRRCRDCIFRSNQRACECVTQQRIETMPLFCVVPKRDISTPRKQRAKGVDLSGMCSWPVVFWRISVEELEKKKQKTSLSSGKKKHKKAPVVFPRWRSFPAATAVGP